MLIGELADLAGTSPRTLRYYEEHGLVRASRDANGYRQYEDGELRVVHEIRTLLASGFGLDDIRPFDELVLRSRLPVVVDFWASWCPPCGPMSRLLGELAGDYRGQLVIGTVDADENPVAMRAHRVLAMPTLLFFRDGVVTSSIVGLRPRSVLRAALTGAVTPYVNS